MRLADVAYGLGGRICDRFSTVFPIYDWVYGDGYNNLGTWVESAAQLAGRVQPD